MGNVCECVDPQHPPEDSVLPEPRPVDEQHELQLSGHQQKIVAAPQHSTEQSELPSTEKEEQPAECAEPPPQAEKCETNQPATEKQPEPPKEDEKDSLPQRSEPVNPEQSVVVTTGAEESPTKESVQAHAQPKEPEPQEVAAPTDTHAQAELSHESAPQPQHLSSEESAGAVTEEPQSETSAPVEDPKEESQSQPTESRGETATETLKEEEVAREEAAQPQQSRKSSSSSSSSSSSNSSSSSKEKQSEEEREAEEIQVSSESETKDKEAHPEPLEPEVKPELEPGVELEPEPASDPEPLESEVKPELDPGVELEPEPASDPEPLEPEVKPELDPGVELEPEPASDPEPLEPEVKPELDPGVELEPEPASDPVQQPEPQVEAPRFEAGQAESEPEPGPEPIPEVDAEQQLPTEVTQTYTAESEAKLQSETQTEPQAEPEPEPELDQQTALEPELDPAAVMEQPSDEEEVEVAGASRLMRAFATGNTLALDSCASGRSLRIVGGEVEGQGAHGKKAQFVIHVRRKKVVALQNVKDPSAWLKIQDNKLSGDGTGDEFCEFQLEEHDGYIVLESVCFPGQHVGILPNGEAKPPQNTGTGEHARFTPIIIKPTVAGESEILQLFTTGNKVVLTSVASGKALWITNGDVEGQGNGGKKAQFTVHVRRNGVVALQNVKDPAAWLRVFNSKLLGDGKGGQFCEFKVDEVDGCIVLESVCFPGQHVGILPNGEAKPPQNTGTGEHARFTVVLKPAVAGDSELLSKFEQNNRIVLESKASNGTLRIREGVVEGRGGHGTLAQFIVHVRGPGVIALQNVKDPRLWLRIKDSELQSKGRSGPFTEFKVLEVEGYVVLESVRFPGQHVGILPDGDAKPADQTGTGEHARFTPIVKGKAAEMIHDEDDD